MRKFLIFSAVIFLNQQLMAAETFQCRNWKNPSRGDYLNGTLIKDHSDIKVVIESSNSGHKEFTGSKTESSDTLEKYAFFDSDRGSEGPALRLVLNRNPHPDEESRKFWHEVSSQADSETQSVTLWSCERNS